jgi:hypothetical protein
MVGTIQADAHMTSDIVSSLGLDLSSGTLTLPAWAAGVIAVLFLIVLMVAILRTSLSDLSGAILRLGLLAIVALGAWVWFDRTAETRRAEERRALDSRTLALTTQAIGAGSALACLDATVGENVEGACERSVFSSAEAVAAAAAYVEARMQLLSEAHDFAARRDPGYEGAIAGLRRTIEADRFGIAAQVLASRDGCTAEKCDYFAMVHDPARLRANLKERTYDTLVARHAASWPARPRAPAALSSATPPSSGLGSPVPPGFSLPSAASIPPVSIMNSEPAGSPPPSAAAPPTAGAAASEPPASAPAPTRRPPPRPKQAQTKDAPPAPPVQLVPQAAQ